MGNWLTYTAHIVRCRKLPHVADSLLMALKANIEAKSIQLLFPSADNTEFTSHDPNLSQRWQITDFNTPLAHVIQSREPMLLGADELPYWQADKGLKEITKIVGLFDGVWFKPLLNDNGAICAVLFVISDYQDLIQVADEPEFLTLLETFVLHWERMSEMQYQAHDMRLLHESISELRHSSQRRCQLREMAVTLIGQSEAMKLLREQTLTAASSFMSVLIQGDTGTGKELVARAIHDFSVRAGSSFIAINCTAIPESLLESELFGYVKGAFSGANNDKEGLISQANGGTLFLDEIGDMPLGLQAKLLRVLESKQYRPLGGKCEYISDFRLVSATHVNLYQEVQDKRFRQDLYYRLLQFPIRLLPLISRGEDLLELTNCFVEQFNRDNDRDVRGIDSDAMACLKRHSFPGNVRELKHLVQFGCALTMDGQWVSGGHIRQVIERDIEISNEVDVESCIGEGSCSADITDLKEALKQYEERVIRERLALFLGNRRKAAESLSIPKRTLAYKCLKWGIKF